MNLLADGVDHSVTRPGMGLLRSVVIGDAAHVATELSRSSPEPSVLARYAALAAANGQLEVLKILRENGADILAEEQLSLRLAAAGGWTAVVDYLVQHGAMPEKHAAELVKSAARHGHVQMLEHLRRLGCDLAPCRALIDDIAANPLLSHVVDYLGDRLPGGVPLARLLAAIRSGSMKAVVAAMPGNDLPAHAGILLETAARAGATRILRHLYESGADLQPVKARVLYAAAENGRYDTLERLITVYGCDPGLTATAAELAAENGHIGCLRLIWTTGGAKSRPSRMTLKLAALNGHEQTFDYLTHAGGLDAIEEDREIVCSMVQEILAAPAIYRPSELWEHFNEVNLEQLRRFGMHRFKRSINQNYFNFLPVGLRDPQLASLMRHFIRRPPLRTLAAIRMTDPDRYPGSGDLMAADQRIFRLWQHRPLFAPAGRWFQRGLYRFLVALLWRYTESQDGLQLRRGLQEPRLGVPLVIGIGGRLISQDLAHSILECNSILCDLSQSADEPTLLIAEIGAGYGRVGDVLLSTRRCRYFVFDIPPSLYVSQWYLRQRHPFKRVFAFRHIERFEDIKDELDAADIAFFTPNQIPLFPDGYFDIAINISSLHEMRLEQMHHMLAQMYRMARDRVYIKQYLHYVNPWDKIELSERDYFVAEGWKKKLWRKDPVDARFFEALLVNKESRALARPRHVAGDASPARPTVSILLANHNDGHYLYTSLEGILSQTDPADEIIVVDDGSSDDSIEVIEKMLAPHHNARLVRQERNRGQHAAIQRALLEASSDYVIWAASDDLLLPRFIERSRDALRKFPGSGVCFSRLCAWREGSSEIEEYSESNHGAAFDLGDSPRYFSPDDLRALLRKHYLWISGNTVLARRDLLLEMGGFDSALRWHADWFSYYAIALRAGACGIPETLAMMRERPETYSRAGMRNRKHQDKVLGALLDTLNRPCYRDLHAVFMRCPSMLSPFGRHIVYAATRRPRYWAAAARLARWHAKHTLMPRIRGWLEGRRDRRSPD